MANEGNMTAEMVLQIGRATAYACKEHHAEKGTRPRIIIGKDTRLSGYMLENALTAGITSMGVDVLLLGPIPTPAVAFITQSMRADAGIVISASHNPYFDNGIKIFSRTGYKLPDEMEAEIEDLVLSKRINDIRPVAQEVGKAKRIDDAMGRYIEFCKNTFPDGMTLDGMNVVLDCSNGATYKCAPIIFSELGAAVTTIHAEPNGLNINDDCGSQHTQDLRAKVKELSADVGLAFDGDGDRLIAVDETGRELTGDQIIAICTKHYKDNGLLKNNLVIGTVMSNIGFHVALRDLGIDTDISDVGDRCVLELMQEKDAVLGGEDSGHIIFHNYHTTGDGIVSALQLLGIMHETGRSLSSLAEIMTVFPQVLINVDVSEKPPLSEVEKLQSAIADAEAELADKGRVLVRYSGTQPMCRVMVEGPTEALTKEIAERLAGIVTEAIG
jgi:phosphoglucosamine mutase